MRLAQTEDSGVYDSVVLACDTVSLCNQIVILLRNIGMGLSVSVLEDEDTKLPQLQSDAM
jgi:hypothetical protein